MAQTKKLRLASFLTYLGHFLLVFVLALVCFISAVTADPEGWEALGVAILLVLSVIGFIYAVILLLPLLFSFFAYRKDIRAFTIACMPFDGLYVLVHLVYILSLCISGDRAALVLLPTFALSSAPLILNILSLKNKTAPQDTEAPSEKGEQL